MAENQPPSQPPPAQMNNELNDAHREPDEPELRFQGTIAEPPPAPLELVVPNPDRANFRLRCSLIALSLSIMIVFAAIIAIIVVSASIQPPCNCVLGRPMLRTVVSAAIDGLDATTFDEPAVRDAFADAVTTAMNASEYTVWILNVTSGAEAPPFPSFPSWRRASGSRMFVLFEYSEELNASASFTNVTLLEAEARTLNGSSALSAAFVAELRSLEPPLSGVDVDAVSMQVLNATSNFILPPMYSSRALRAVSDSSDSSDSSSSSSSLVSGGVELGAEAGSDRR